MKWLILALACVLLAPMFLAGITTSAPYDAWADLDDDGDIDIFDIVTMAGRYGTTGTPINKTAILLELQAEVEEHEATLEWLLDMMMEAADLNVSIIELQVGVNRLNESVAALEAQVASLESLFPVTSNGIGNGAITAEKLAAEVIPYASSHVVDVATIFSTSWTDVPSMSVTMTSNRTSHLLIMFSAEAACATGYSDFLLIQALVDSMVAYPNDATGTIVVTDGENWGAHSFVFFMPSVGAGTHTIKIQSRMGAGAVNGFLGFRSLNVIALPA